MALADEWLAMLGRRRCGRELLEMTVHPEKIVSGGENSSEAASSYPAECGDRCGKKAMLENRALWQFFSTYLSELTVPPGSARCQAGERQRVDRLFLPARVGTRAVLAKGTMASSEGAFQKVRFMGNHHSPTALVPHAPNPVHSLLWWRGKAS